MRIVRLANYVAPHSGGLRTSLRELGAGYLAAGHEPVLIIPGERDSDEQTPQGRVITLTGPRLPFTGGYRALLRRRRVAARADVAIAPGPAETFGLAALEALACGTPVVVSAESALPEVVGEAGASVAGEDLSAGVMTVLSWAEPARRAAARARAERFGWPAAVRAFLAIHEALGGAAARAAVTVERRPA
jgi:glycosyltransferase involved in cell wall biosynthesis